MEERKDPRTAGAEAANPSEGRDAEATSSETLGDLEAKTKVKADRRDQGGGESGSASNVPAPDGASGDAGRDTADSRSTGEPM